MIATVNVLSNHIPAGSCMLIRMSGLNSSISGSVKSEVVNMPSSSVAVAIVASKKYFMLPE